LNIIRDEFEEEISLLKIKEREYNNSRGQTYPMFILTISQAKQVLVRESKFVRKAIISYFEVLEENLNTQNYVYLKSINKTRKIIIGELPLFKI
jgi:phage regulator Rha-like protein